MKKALITGITGQDGSFLAEFLIEKGYEVHASESVTQYVTDDDEWIAEAYLETDYSQITQSDFEKVVRDYAMFKLLSEHGIPSSSNSEEE